MAQKTPLPALTINYADRWNGTWFSDLSNFKQKLKEDYYLRFLILSYLRKKKYWLHFLSINNSAGFFFFQMVFLNAKSQATVKPFLFPNNFSKASLQIWEKELNRNNPLFKRAELKLWQKRLSYKKEDMWLDLNRRVLLKQSKMFLLGNKYLYPEITMKNALVQDKSLEAWFALQTNELTLAFAQPALYFLLQKFLQLHVLLKIIIRTSMFNTKFLPHLPIKVESLLKSNFLKSYHRMKLVKKPKNLVTTYLQRSPILRDLKDLKDLRVKTFVKSFNNFNSKNPRDLSSLIYYQHNKNSFLALQSRKYIFKASAAL